MPSWRKLIQSGSNAKLNSLTVYSGSTELIIENSLSESVSSPLTITHRTTGVPGNNIGTSIEFKTETSKSNYEIGSIIESVAVDTIKNSEDFNLVVYIMANGTGSIERMKIQSDGEISGSFITQFSHLRNVPTLLSGSVQIATEISGAFTNTSSSLSSRITTNENDISTLNSKTLVSASAQINHDLTLNYTGSEHFEQKDIIHLGTITQGNINSILPNGILSGSAQIATEISGAFTNTSSSLASRVTTLEDETVYSGSFSGSFEGDGSGLTGDATQNSTPFSASFAISSSFASNVSNEAADGQIRTIVLTAAGGAPLTTAGCSDPTKVESTTNNINYFVLDFDTSSEEHASWMIAMPDSYDGGTLTARFIWTNTAGSASQTVVWGIAGRSWGNDEAIDQALGTEITVTDTFLAQGDVHVSDESSAITLSGTPVGGEMANFVVARKVASDDLTGDARLIMVKLEYTISQFSD